MPEAEAGAVAPESPIDGNGEYVVTLQALTFPVAGHLLFNGIAGLAMLLLGHPWIAAWAFALSMAADVLQQALVRRWKRSAADIAQDKGMRLLAFFCAARTTAAMLPIAVLIVRGGVAEMMLAAAMIFSLLAIGQAMGSLSSRLFWGYVGPILATMALVAAMRLPPLAAAGVLLAVASCALLMWMLSHNTTRMILAWRAEYDAKTSAVAELQIARDEARQANRAKSNFLATMSHEIRTPMNGVLGMAQLPRRDETEPTQKQRLDVLIDSGEYLLSILNDILDVSKIDAGRLDIVEAAGELRPFLERLVGFWGARADEKGVALTLQIDATVPDLVLMDSLRLRQVLFNLVGNALKFTDQGQVEVAADARAAGDDAVHLHIAVRDTGPGIAADQLPMLFDRFSQADESEVRRFGGTGLGLAIAKQLIELMAGRIWAESRPGQGSTFHIELPLTLVTLGERTLDREGDHEAPARLDGLRVLAVDDNAVNLLVLDQLLTSLGCQIVKASSGGDALKAASGEIFDLVLMDIQMPGMTGTEALHRLRAGSGPNHDAPVIALTADVTSGGRERYLSLGFGEHSSKPIQIEDLMEAMSRSVSARPRAAAQAA